MIRLRAGCLLAFMVAAGAARAQDKSDLPDAPIPAHDVVPSSDQTGVVHVNAAPEAQARTYRALVAGMDRFDSRHALAPAVPQLLFEATISRRREVLPPGLAVKLSGATLSLPLLLDAEARFAVPRSQAAWDQKADLVFNQRQSSKIRVYPYVRTPGLAPDVLRLGDLRLVCQVEVAIAKEEAPLLVVLAANALFRSTDWCGMDRRGAGGYSMRTPPGVARAVLQEGNRSRNVQIAKGELLVPIGDTSWGDDALIMLEFAAPADPSATTRTAGETPRTGP